MRGKKTIVICSSGAFYKHVIEIADHLSKQDFNVVVPATAAMMLEAGDYDINKFKTWRQNEKDLHIKVKRAEGHFDEIKKGDAILIVNDDKPDQPRYLGPNTVMEWGLAYHLKKPVFILNGVSKDHNAYEEVYSMSAAVLDGDLGKIKL